MSESLVVKEYLAKIQAHLDRANSTLTYLDGAFDIAIALIDNAPVGALRAKFEPFTCIIPLAPIGQIQKCLAGGGIVCAIIGTKAQWIASASSVRNNVLIVQIIECNTATAKVIYAGGDVDVITNPAQKILAGCMFWVGG